MKYFLGRGKEGRGAIIGLNSFNKGYGGWGLDWGRLVNF